MHLLPCPPRHQAGLGFSHSWKIPLSNLTWWWKGVFHKESRHSFIFFPTFDIKSSWGNQRICRLDGKCFMYEPVHGRYECIASCMDSLWMVKWNDTILLSPGLWAIIRGHLVCVCASVCLYVYVSLHYWLCRFSLIEWLFFLVQILHFMCSEWLCLLTAKHIIRFSLERGETTSVK